MGVYSFMREEVAAFFWGSAVLSLTGFWSGHHAPGYSGRVPPL
jgi:hypothetical protein